MVLDEPQKYLQHHLVTYWSYVSPLMYFKLNVRKNRYCQNIERIKKQLEFSNEISKGT